MSRTPLYTLDYLRSFQLEMYKYLEEKGLSHSVFEPREKPKYFKALYMFVIYVPRPKMMREVLDPGLREIAKRYKFQMRIRDEGRRLTPHLEHKYSVTYRKPMHAMGYRRGE